MGDVWEIGGRTAEKLAGYGILTVVDFLRLGPREVRENVVGGGGLVQAELRGVSYLSLALMGP
ncbi:hypothetical protein [Acidiphilium acidophilum]|uniref:hypothetical protein n=1 Tax=Acidiphilium acidophilum TaxID=76588 RepID=UPI002E8E7494|nr:hypothetical protein [Acidiphilium acidophilum]